MWNQALTLEQTWREAINHHTEQCERYDEQVRSLQEKLRTTGQEVSNMSNNKKTIMCKQNEMIIDLETKVNELKSKLLTMDKDRNQLRAKHKTLSEDNIAQSRAIEKA